MTDTASAETREDRAPEPEFEFLSDLARELSAGRVELPSFPDAVARVQSVLSDDSVTSERIARVVSADASLAARILTMANSALLHRGGSPMTDLKMAITRIGHDNVRTAALAYASAQLRLAPELVHIRQQLEQCWQEATRVAALAHAISQEVRWPRPDEALLAGLLHNIGKVYILARQPKQSAGAACVLDEKTLQQWYPGIGQAVIENWQLSEQIAQAVGGQLEQRADPDMELDLQQLLAAAVGLAAQMQGGDASSTGSHRVMLNLSESSIVRIVLESQTELEILQQALS